MPTLQPAKVLRRASEIVGGNNKLAEILGVSTLTLADWIDGNELPPSLVIFTAIDIVKALGKENRPHWVHPEPN
jgi:DNA-binding transcriptional regulator YdaS (Cro superfamily)